MLTITGEVRKVLDDQYKNKQDQEVKQAILVIEPPHGRQNYEVFLSARQVQSGAKDAWSKLIGKQASVPVSLFVNHEYRFYKFNAVGNGMPTSSTRSA
ncbi:hypothetical protein [Spongiibacter marinus]|uniref:hypothetical protein n=1 Tax=Spongiibacter marinus TaxID=354246 RepID=UPI003563D7A1